MGHRDRTAAIIVAAGRSERMGGVDKIFVQLAGRPLLAWTVAPFQRCDAIDDIVLVCAPDASERARALAREWRFRKVASAVAGGADRPAWVRAGLEATADAATIVIHDGARPLVTEELVLRGVEAARETGAALCAMPARDTVKETDAGGRVVATHDRRNIWLAQTPQVFARDLLLRAHRQAEASATDDAALVEAVGGDVRVYEGGAWNIKVTTPADVVIAEALLHERFAAPRE